MSGLQRLARSCQNAQHGEKATWLGAGRGGAGGAQTWLGLGLGAFPPACPSLGLLGEERVWPRSQALSSGEV